jgi:hypothetical protein
MQDLADRLTRLRAQGLRVRVKAAALASGGCSQ